MTEQQQTGDQYEGNALAQTVARYARTFSATRRHIINPDDQNVTLCGGRISLHELYVSDGGTARMAAPWMVYTQIPCQRCERSAAKRGIRPDTRERNIDQAHTAALAEDAERAVEQPAAVEDMPAEMLAGGALELARELLAAADHDEQPVATVETPIAWRGAPEWRPCGPECMGWCLLVDAPCDAARTAAAPTLNDFEPADECDGADRPADAPTGDDGIAAAAGRILGLRTADDLDRAALLELVMRYRDARVADADTLLEVIRQRLGAEPLGDPDGPYTYLGPFDCITPSEAAANRAAAAAAPTRPDCGRMPGRTHDQCTHDALVIMSSRGPISTASLPAGVVGWLVGDGLAQAADAAGSTLELTDEGGRAAGRVRARMTAAAAG